MRCERLQCIEKYFEAKEETCRYVGLLVLWWEQDTNSKDLIGFNCPGSCPLTSFGSSFLVTTCWLVV